jgi:hypothetical protein
MEEDERPACTAVAEVNLAERTIDVAATHAEPHETDRASYPGAPRAHVAVAVAGAGELAQAVT